MLNTATLPLLLKQLGLQTICNNWEQEEINAQEQKWTHSQYLAVLSENEVAARKQRRIERYIKDAKLPVGKSLDTFDFKSAKSVNMAQIISLADNTSWVKQARNIVIFGPSGVGKTHLAAAIAYSLITHGIRTLFTQTTTLVQKLQQARAEYKLPEMLAKLSMIPLLILDDIGYVKKDNAESGVLFELIAHRYETNSIIITSNQPFGEWDQIFPDNIMAVAAVDRIIHHATIISIHEQSYRKAHSLKEKT